MTDDLKQRLRAVCETGCDPDLPFEAADRIEQLESENANLLDSLVRCRVFATDRLPSKWAKQIIGFCSIAETIGPQLRHITFFRRDYIDSTLDAAIAKLKWQDNDNHK